MYVYITYTETRLGKLPAHWVKAGGYCKAIFFMFMFVLMFFFYLFEVERVIEKKIEVNIIENI